MKKLFVLFIALTFVLSMAVFAVADDGGAIVSMKAGSSVTIGGDARVRGIWKNNYNLTEDGDGAAQDRDVRNYDQRLRLKITAAIGNGIEMRSRLTTGTDQWDGSKTTNTSGNITVDYMYLHIPVNSVVIDVGNMDRNWGNRLLIWDSNRDTLQLTTNVGDIQLGVYQDKVDDSSSVANANVANQGIENLEDYNNYGGFVNFTSGSIATGLHIIYERDKASTSATQKGLEASAYLTTSVGAINILSEIAYKKGGLNEDSAGKKPVAGFVYAETEVGAINVNLFVAVAKNGFVADSHLTPTVFFGTDNPTAIANVMAAADKTTKAIALGVGTDISSDLSVSAKLAYFDLEGLSATFRTSNPGGAAPAKANDESAIEIDLGLKYKLSDNAVYSVDFGYLIPDNITLADDEAVALMHKIEVAF